MKCQFILAVWLVFFCCSNIWAEDLNYNLVDFDVQVEKKVSNDKMKVTMTASSQRQKVQEASKQVNQDMAWALESVSNKKSIEARSLGYATYPQYKNSIITGWRVRQQLLMESTDVDSLTDMAGLLQQKLAVENMQFYVSSEKKQASIDRLTAKALLRFHKRAEIIVKNSGGKDYKIVSVTLSNGGQQPPVMGKSYRMEAMAAGVGAAPAVEAGESVLAVRAAGTIQVIYE